MIFSYKSYHNFHLVFEFFKKSILPFYAMSRLLKYAVKRLPNTGNSYIFVVRVMKLVLFKILSFIPVFQFCFNFTETRVSNEMKVSCGTKLKIVRVLI